jgi:hypothetical protein
MMARGMLRPAWALHLIQPLGQKRDKRVGRAKMHLFADCCYPSVRPSGEALGTVEGTGLHLESIDFS